eukprot:scaffold4091_cov100-Isochrysis_galbana.AAC.2
MQLPRQRKVDHAHVPRPAGRPDRPHLQKGLDAVCSAEATHGRGSVRQQDLADRRAPARGVGSGRRGSQSGGWKLAQAVRAACGQRGCSARLALQQPLGHQSAWMPGGERRERQPERASRARTAGGGRGTA